MVNSRLNVEISIEKLHFKITDLLLCLYFLASKRPRPIVLDHKSDVNFFFDELPANGEMIFKVVHRGVSRTFQCFSGLRTPWRYMCANPRQFSAESLSRFFYTREKDFSAALRTNPQMSY